jgi:hypothetical protein
MRPHLHAVLHALRIALAATLLALAGCASTRVESSGTPLKEPLCRAGAPVVATAVVWGTQWRPDQKEPALREAAALRGIEGFLGSTRCLAVTGVKRFPGDAEPPSDAQLLQQLAASPARADRIVLIVVRELGPRLTVGLPVIVEGGTEVLIDVRVLDPRQAAPLASTRTQWRHGGSFVIKGVQTLDHDMSAALRATLMPGSVTADDNRN